MGVAGHGRERTPSEVLGIKEVRGCDGGILRKYTEEVGEATVDTAEGD